MTGMGGPNGRPAVGRPLKLAVVTRPLEALSLRHARESIVREFPALGVVSIPVPEGRLPPPSCDLLWDPALAGTRGPRRIRGLPACIPTVATAHGAAAFVLPWRHVWRNPARALWGQVRKHRALADWRWLNSRAGAVVGVSDFGVQEVGRVFGVPPGKLHRIYPGVSSAIFRPDGECQPGRRPYLLYVAQYSPKKNLEAVLAAYASLPRAARPDLVAVVPGWPGGRIGVEGVHLLREALTHDALARWYRGALALVFPSLHETFGHPILEAMACGCPVITSTVTACPEVAGSAALLVDPRSVKEIAEAMCRIRDAALRRSLREQGLARARPFTWRATAERYLELFQGLIRSTSTGPLTPTAAPSGAGSNVPP